MILYLTGNEHFLETTPIGDPMKSRKGDRVNDPALCPAATLLARYSMMTSGCSKVDLQLSKIMLVLLLSKPMSTPCSMPLSSLLHHTWSGWLNRYLQKLLRCSGDCATKTTLGSRMLLLTVAANMGPFAMGECTSVLLTVVTAFSSVMEPLVWLSKQAGFDWAWLWHLPCLSTLVWSLHHLQQGSLGKGAPVH